MLYLATAFITSLIGIIIAFFFCCSVGLGYFVVVVLCTSASFFVAKLTTIWII